jgi:hypothetical protein
MDIHTPDLVKEYHQRKPTAIWAVTLKGQQDGFEGNPMFQTSLTEIFDEDEFILYFAEEHA